MHKKISVIIPCYNISDYLRVAVRSILEQGIEDVEIILVNDGSVDRTPEVCDEFANSDDRIKVIHQKNQGVVAARKNGFLASSGEIILFVDGDDALEPGSLSKIQKEFSENSIDLVRFGFNMVFVDGRKVSTETPPLNGSYTPEELLSLGVDNFKSYCSWSIWDKGYSRELVSRVFDQFGEVKINHSEDMLFAMASFLFSNRVKFLEEPLYIYLQREGSVIHSFNRNSVVTKEKYFHSVESLLKNHFRNERQDSSQRLLELEANESINYVLYNTMRYGPSFMDILRVIRALRKSNFFKFLCDYGSGLRLKQYLRNLMILSPIVATLILFFWGRCAKSSV